MEKNILFGQEARKRILDGISKLAKATSITLGGEGRNVVFETRLNIPIVTRDGVTVAKNVFLTDPIEKMGSDLVREVALKTNIEAGDGTTTAIILAESLIRNSFLEVENGISPIFIKHGLEKELSIILEKLKEKVQKIIIKKQLIDIAQLSAQDNQLGNLVADVVWNVGIDGVITVEESKTFGIVSEIVMGMRIDKGYISPHMTTNYQKMISEFKDPYILLINTKIATLTDIIPICDKLSKQGIKELVIIADEYAEEVLGFLVVNKLHGMFNALAIRSPSFGENRKKILEDIAILTNGQVISKEMGVNLENITIEMLGRAEKVVATKDSMTIIGGNGSQENVQKRIKQIKNELMQNITPFDKEQCEQRIARLTGGVSVIRVGVASEVESKEKQYRIEDAINASKAALSEGIIEGGGIPLLRIGLQYSQENPIGRILYNTLIAPCLQILTNGGEDTKKILDNFSKENYNIGYNVITKQYGNLFEMGIIDPLKVTRIAIENAFSVATTVLTTEVVISLDEKQKNVNSPK